MNMKVTSPANGGFKNTLEHGVDSATTAAHHTINSVSDAARPALDSMVSGAHHVVDRAGVAATHAAETLGVKGEQLNVNSRKIINQTQGYVRENPLASLGIAVAAGYFLSWLLSSR